MTAKKTMTSKEVLQSDPVFTFWERAQAYVQENARQLAAIGMVVVVAAAAIALWRVTALREQQESRNLFNRGMSLLAQSEDSTVDRDIAVTQALETFDSLAETHAGTASGGAALLYAGNCCYQLQRYDDAIQRYTAFLDRAGNDLSYLLPFAYGSIGYAYEAKGDYGEACQWFDRQRSGETGATFSLAVLNAARCYEERGEREQACALYREFTEKYPFSSFKELAQVKAAALCAEG